MRTSGLILDIYDDCDGETLRALYPTAGDIPDNVKLASPVTGALRDSLPDDVFALVLVNNGEKMRKYAGIDPGNTELSVEYFLKHAHKLPLEAQKVAAENLVTMCGWYDLAPPEELKKIAGLGSLGSLAMKVVDPLMKAQTIMGAGNQISQNMHAASEAGGQLLPKLAEVSGTITAPNEEPADPSTPSPKTTINKTARVGHLVHHSGGDVPPELVQPVSGEMGKSAPQAKALRSTVDVSNASPPQVAHEKKASVYALSNPARYPLDSYAQVKMAGEYFEEFHTHFTPEVRREYALSLVKQASKMGIDVPETAGKYGSEKMAPDFEVKFAFDQRRQELQSYPRAIQLLDAVEEEFFPDETTKTAGMELSVGDKCSLLSEFDRQVGLDRSYDITISDPFFSTYGVVKEASDATWSDIIGSDMVTYADLYRLSKVGTHTLRDTFGEEFQEDFRKDPVGIYESLPRDQKRMIMHMAAGTTPGAEPAY